MDQGSRASLAAERCSRGCSGKRELYRALEEATRKQGMIYEDFLVKPAGPVS